MKKEKNNKSVNSDKKKLGTRFMDTLKKRWLISRTNTLLLIAILIAIVILINSAFASLDLTPIDCTANNEYTLTDESKERIKDITNKVNIYFVGFEDGDATISLAKQYNKVNENINVEEIDINERTDIASKYNIESSSQVIIVENGEKSKVLYSDDLYTYDSSYNTIDLTEEKITSAILNVSSDKIANVYFLTGYSDYSLDYSGGMSYLAAYLEDEILNYNTLFSTLIIIVSSCFSIWFIPICIFYIVIYILNISSCFNFSFYYIFKHFNVFYYIFFSFKQFL